MSNPFFSVVIPMFNSEKTIMRTLESVVNQLYRDFEIIVIDDGSNDNSVKVARKFLNNYKIDFSIITLNENKGVSVARNVGIRNSSGKYIAFIDSDDLWDKKKLKIQFEYIKKYNLKWVFSNFYVIDKNYVVVGRRERKAGFYNYNQIISEGNPVGLLTCVVKSELLKKDDFKNMHHEDYDLWIRLAKNGVNGFLINDNLGYYTKSNGSLSSNKIKSFFWTLTVYRVNNIKISDTFKFMIGYIKNILKRKN